MVHDKSKELCSKTALPSDSDLQRPKECPEGVRSRRSVNTNTSGRTRGPGGQEEVNEVFGDVEDGWKHQSDGEQVKMDGIWCQMDGATSSIRCDSIRAETRLLAGPPKRLQKLSYEAARP